MTVRQYVALMLIGTIATWVAWVSVVAFLDPATAGWRGFSFFYLALYLALVGTFSLLGFGVRRFMGRQELVTEQVTIAFRQALSLGFMVVAALFLQSQQLLTWWNMLFLVLALTLLEFAIAALHRPRIDL